LNFLRLLHEEVFQNATFDCSTVGSVEKLTEENRVVYNGSLIFISIDGFEWSNSKRRSSKPKILLDECNVKFFKLKFPYYENSRCYIFSMTVSTADWFYNSGQAKCLICRLWKFSRQTQIMIWEEKSHSRLMPCAFCEDFSQMNMYFDVNWIVFTSYLCHLNLQTYV